MTKKKAILTAEKLLLMKNIIEKRADGVIFESNFLDSEILVDRLPIEAVMDIMQNETKSVFKRQCQLIYESCKCFRNEELIKAYEIDEPYDIVEKIYGSALLEFNDLLETILSMYGYLDIKNKIKK